MNLPAFAWRTLACGWWLAAAVALAEDKPAAPAGSPPLLLNEVWVPASALDPILARYPRAVSLGRDQLFTLLHDAHAADPAAVDPATAPPEHAMLRQARFEGRLIAGPEGEIQVRVNAELEVEAFSDAWSEIPLGLRGIVLGTAEIDDGQPANLRLPWPADHFSTRLLQTNGSHPLQFFDHPDTNPPPVLLIQGRGVHRLHLGFLLPVETGANGSTLLLPAVEGVGEFTLHLPAGARANCERGCAVVPDGAGVLARVALGAVAKDHLIWRTLPPLPGTVSALLQSGQMAAWVEASAITIRQKVVLKAALGPLPAEVQVPLPSEGRAVRVEGAANWTLGADGLRVTLDPSNQEDWGGVWFGVTYELPLALDSGGAVTKISVPLLEVAGAHRVVGHGDVLSSPGVQVRRIEPSAIATPAGGASALDIVAQFSLSDMPPPGNVPPPVALTLEARRATARFSVDADARADFQPDGVHIHRTLVFQVEEGELFTARVKLPPGEVLLSLGAVGNHSEFDWNQHGDELQLNWKTGVTEPSKTLLLESRADLVPPAPGAPVNAAFRAALVPGAERLTGYVALASAPALRLVTTGGEERLERRDGRTTPIKGDVAWFYRDDFGLALRVERRATETEARFTGYALPLAGAVEIHGQIDYRFLNAGVEAVKIRVAADTADAFFFTGAHIAERRREGDVWTIRFQGEQTGDYVLGVQATIPAPADSGDAERFHFRLPTVAPLETARWSGEWAVEANTDTEIGFRVAGASEGDTLHAPVLAGYQPRRRVIGVFEFLGGTAEAAIDLDGVRHPAAGVAAAIVDRLTLETFASTSGVARHRATMRARTAADGFFNLRLPDGAALWSLTRDGELIKPVGGAAGDLRVELPGGREPSAASTVVAIYETPGQPWTSAGRRTLAAPRFDPGVPVVESRWTLHLPDGFDYRIDEHALTNVPATVSTGDLLLPQIGVACGHVMQWMVAKLWQSENPQIAAAFSVSRMLDEPVQELAPPTNGLMPASPPNDPAQSAQFIAPVQQVKQLFAEAQGFYDTARYDLAYKRYEQILALDPYNDAARKGQERVDLARAKHGNPASYDHTRGHLLRQVDQGWDLPANRKGADADARRNLGKVRDEQSTAAITRKLQSLIIPNIEFRSTTLGDAIEFLRQESRRLDTDPDPAQRGVNIFLKLSNAGTASEAASSASTRITLTMSRLPLLEALKYVAQQAGLKVKVEQYAVSIVPLSEVTDTLVTQEFRVSPTFISSDPAVIAGKASISLADARTFLEASGVTFPPGASATYLPATGKLVVRNTQENLDLIDSLRQENSTVPPPLDSLVTLNGHQFTPGQIKDADPNSPLFGNDKLATAEFSVPPDFLTGTTEANAGRDVTGVGSVTIQRQDAKTFLEAQGYAFPPGASATYLASTGKIVIRNTPEAIKQMTDALARGNRSGTYGVSANAVNALLFNGKAGRDSEARVAGLLPIRLDLPANGRAYEFAGGGEPGTLDFHYTDWRSAARWRWVWLTVGAVAFLLFAAGWAHPWRRTCWVALALTFFPLVAVSSALTPCNALLAGWLWAVLGWCVTRFLLRRRRFAAMAILCGVASLPGLAHAAPQAEPTPAPSPEMVIVPYDATRPAAAQQPDRYYLPYERFLELWDAAKRHRRPPLPEPPPGGERSSLNTARYDARLVGDTLEIDAALDLQTFGEGWVAVPLKFDGERVGALTLDGTPASLSADGVLWVGTPGTHHVAASLRLPAGKLSAGTNLAWSVPPTAATLVTLLLPRPDLRAEVRSDAPGGGVVEETVPEGRRFTASAGGATVIKLGFRDVLLPAPGSGEAALVRVRSRLGVGARQETLRSEVKFAFPGRTQDHFTVYLGAGLTLTNLDAPGLREWHLSTGGDRQTLDLVLDAPARNGYALSLEADRPTPGAGTQRRTFPVVTAQAGRVEQTAALLMDGPLEITLPDGPPAGARRTEFSAAAEEGRLFGAFESDGSPGLVYSVAARTEKRAAHIDYLYQVGRGKIELAASVRLAPAAGGGAIQTADLRLPAGFAVQTVAGGAVSQWWRDGDVLSVRFRETPPGEVSLVVYLVRPLERAPDRLALRPLAATGFTDTDGQTVVAADRSFKVSLTLPTGVRARDLNEIDPATAASEFLVKAPLERQRAFRYRGADFDVGATLEALPALWEVQTVTRATVREGTVALETRVNVEARRGVLDALEFSLPAGLAEAGVSGPEVREAVPGPVAAGQDRRTYRVLFQNPLYGGSEAAFTVSLALPLGPDGRAALPELRFPGGRSAAGFLLVENASAGEMTLGPHGLDPAIEKDVPFLPARIVAGTRFFRVAPGVPWSLDIAVANLEKTAGRSALVAYAELTSTLRANGEEWHRATYRLQNRRLQFLPVELPAGVEFIGARVAGESVRVDAGPAEKDGRASLLVPLLKTRPGELSYDVELVYRRPPTGRSRAWERWQLEDPRLPGIPVEKTLWDVFLPDDTRLLSSGGNLEPVVAALNETEKLESALSDLRNLSATYQSTRVTRQEQQLALSNFNSLSDVVKRQAEAVTPRSRVVKSEPSFFRQPDASSQNAVVNQKQASIRRELDSLSTANAAGRSSDVQGGQFVGGLSVTRDQNRTTDAEQGSADFDGFINYGSPIQSVGGTVSLSGQEHAQLWRDNRTLGQDDKGTSPKGEINVGRELAISSKRQLALNDSVTVTLPKPELKSLDDISALAGAGQKDTRLSTARASDGPVAAAKPNEITDLSRAGAASPAIPTLLPAAAPAAPPPPDHTPPPTRESPAGTLRSVGRISLAVNFPQEGQVYHFKKLRADARLTLWSVRPACFERLAWLGVLAVLLAAGWAVKWIVRKRLARRRSKEAAQPQDFHHAV